MAEPASIEGDIRRAVSAIDLRTAAHRKDCVPTELS